MQHIYVQDHSSNTFYIQTLYCIDLTIFRNSTLYIPFNDSVVYVSIDQDKYLTFSNIKIKE